MALEFRRGPAQQHRPRDVPGPPDRARARHLRCFTDRAATQLATQVVLDALPHTHADVVRGLEALEKQSRYLVRKTENGTDWLILIEEGLAAAEVERR